MLSHNAHGKQQLRQQKNSSLQISLTKKSLGLAAGVRPTETMCVLRIWPFLAVLFCKFFRVLHKFLPVFCVFLREVSAQRVFWLWVTHESN